MILFSSSSSANTPLAVSLEWLYSLYASPDSVHLNFIYLTRVAWITMAHHIGRCAWNEDDDEDPNRYTTTATKNHTNNGLMDWLTQIKWVEPISKTDKEWHRQCCRVTGMGEMSQARKKKKKSTERSNDRVKRLVHTPHTRTSQLHTEK